MKGQVSFIIKALILILSIVVFSMIIWQAQNFFSGTVEKKYESEFQMNALGTIQKLINSEDCLAFWYSTSQKGVIEKSKLEDFEEKYKGLEPRCARALSFDYKVVVRTLPINVSTLKKQDRIKNFDRCPENRRRDKCSTVPPTNPPKEKSQGKIETDENKWSFGIGTNKSSDNGFSIGNARKNSLEMRIPVSVRYNPHNYKQAIIKFKAVRGKMERLGSYINKVCEMGEENNKDVKLSLEISFNNPIKFHNKTKPKICMIGREKVCKILDCKPDVEFANIKEGINYLLSIEYINKDNKVMVKK